MHLVSHWYFRERAGHSSIGVATTTRRRHRRILGGFQPGFEPIVPARD
jgi:hypothetical protein